MKHKFKVGDKVKVIIGGFGYRPIEGRVMLTFLLNRYEAYRQKVSWMIELPDDNIHITRKLRKQMTMTEVSMVIEELKISSGLETYREACIRYLEECKDNLDFSDLAKLISTTLKQKLYQEAVDDGFFRGQAGRGSLNEFFDT